jgi:hypothetical protein
LMLTSRGSTAGLWFALAPISRACSLKVRRRDRRLASSAPRGSRTNHDSVAGCGGRGHRRWTPTRRDTRTRRSNAAPEAGAPRGLQVTRVSYQAVCRVLLLTSALWFVPRCVPRQARAVGVRPPKCGVTAASWVRSNSGAVELEFVTRALGRLAKP